MLDDTSGDETWNDSTWSGTEWNDSSWGDSSSTSDGTTGLDSGTGESTETGAVHVCGNGIVEADETCDDPGPTATCDEDCTLAECGDNVINTMAGEQCDDGEPTAACNLNCELIDCGDGVAEGDEQCDDAGESAVCDVDCTPAECGDGVLNITADEQCDDAGESFACDMDCTPADCGDATVNAAANEDCDGANLDGETCQSEGYGAGTLSCNGACDFVTSSCAAGPPVLNLSFTQVREFNFSWAAAPGATSYQLRESPSLGAAYANLGGSVASGPLLYEMPLHLRSDASYVLRACNAVGCTDSATVNAGSMSGAVGYVKASNTGSNDNFGRVLAVSGDGNTLAVGAPWEDSNATGIGGDQVNNNALLAGAVFVFTRTGVGTWSQQAYVKASNTGGLDQFGSSVALSDDGSTLAVGAIWEDSAATGVGGNQTDDLQDPGAVYVFTRNGGGVWSQQAYIKASNTDAEDYFGTTVALNGTGNTLVVGAPGEDSNATGIGGNQANDTAGDAGAAYVFTRSGGVWSQQAYVKASNTSADDQFGRSVALSTDGNTLAVGADPGNGAVYVFLRSGGVWSQQANVTAANPDVGDDFGASVTLSSDGNTLAIGAPGEDSNATGVGGDQSNDASVDSGALYVFTRSGGVWSSQAYIKASNNDASDWLGGTVSLSANGNVLAVGAIGEDSNSNGVAGNQADDTVGGAGAAYVFTRSGVVWSQRAYVKAPNSDAGDDFGATLSLSDDGNTLAVGATQEDSSATGIGGNQADNTVNNAGGAYLY